MARKIRMTKAIRAAAENMIRMDDEQDERDNAVFVALEQARIIDAAMEQLEAERAAAEEAQRNAKLCQCGCGGTPVGKTARFIPGHDGRLKGQLLKQARNEDPAMAQDAATLLAKFGWSHFLVETGKMKKRRVAAENRAKKAAAEAGHPEPAPSSSLTVEDRARIAALKASRNAGMRDLTVRTKEAGLVC